MRDMGFDIASRSCAEVNHLSGKLHALWPAPRGLRVLVVDSGGSVDTVAFDRERARAIHAEHRDAVRRTLSRMRCGLTPTRHRRSRT